MLVITKKCSQCNNLLLATTLFFHKCNTLKSGLRPNCKICANHYQRQHHAKNKQIISEKRKFVRSYNKDKIKKRARQYHIKNKKIINKKAKLYRFNNQDKIKQRSKKYYIKNKEKVKEIQAQWYKKNKHNLKVQDPVILQKQKRRYMLQIASYILLSRLKTYHEVRHDPINKKNGQIKCTYCGKWENTTRYNVISRLNAINGLILGEYNIYCSEECKQACPTYRQVKYPKRFKKATSREVNPYIRQLCFEQDNYTCQKCNKNKNIELHCHHIQGAVKEPLLANDINNVITFCKQCHQIVHTNEGCRYENYKRKKCI